MIRFRKGNYFYMNIHLFYLAENETIAFAAKDFSRLVTEADSSFSCLHNPTDTCRQSTDSVGTLNFQLDSAHAAPLDDSYHISTTPNGGRIAGSNPRSILIGMYAFLEHLGFRFLMPGAHGTIFPPKISASSFYIEIEKTASLRHRGICIEGADSLENIIDFIDWLPKAGFNSFFLQFREPFIFLDRWYSHENNPLLPAEQKDSHFYADCYAHLNNEIKKRALLLHTAGHGWTCEAVNFPSNGWTIAAEEPDASTAQLLAEVNGTRGFIRRIPMNTNLCYSNEAARERFVRAVISYLQEQPDVDFLHIWLADEANHICECPACSGISPTDQYIQLLNQIDSEMERHGLDCHLVFLLYQELLYPPVREQLLHPERFTLMFAPISRSFTHSYPPAIKPVPLPPYRRNQMELPTSIDENLTYLGLWQESFCGDSFVYDYPLGRAHYGDLGYLGLGRVIAGDIQNLSSLGVHGYMSCQELRAAIPNHFPNYLMGHLLFGTSLSCQELEQDYFKAAYGKRWSEVLDYLETLSGRSDCDYFNGKGARVSARKSENYRLLQEEIQRFLPVIAAEQKENPFAPETFFWRLLDYHANYGLRLGKALEHLAAGNSDEANTYFADFCDFIRSRETSMQPYLDVYRIIEVATNYAGFCMPDGTAPEKECTSM